MATTPDLNAATASPEQIESERQVLARKITELESERAEFDLVINALDQLDPLRKAAPSEGHSERVPRRCWQQIGDVLLERRKEEILPVLRAQRRRLHEAIEQLTSEWHQRSTSHGINDRHQDVGGR